MQSQNYYPLRLNILMVLLSKIFFFREETVTFLVFEIIAFSLCSILPNYDIYLTFKLDITELYSGTFTLAKSAQCHTVPVELLCM